MMLPALPMAAAPVDALDAREAASRLVAAQGCGGSSKIKAENPAALRLAYRQPSTALPEAADYYVFDTGGGFVIVAGDDRARAVLAYGDGMPDMAALPCNLHWMLDHYAKQMEWLHTHQAARVKPQFTATTVVEPLLPCTWSQGTPYYDQCPVYHGEHCATGCIATAMAQVMYYWKFPDTLPALPAYTTIINKIHVPALPGTALDWDNMLDGYVYQNYTPAQGEAVARLMRYCGQGTTMEYGTDGSGSGAWNQLVAMQVFGYNLSAQSLYRDDYGTDEWNALMLEDLTEGIPILYTGYGDEGGHAYVVDGFDGSMYHINWGWEGSGNGYFALDAFTVGHWDFSFAQQMQHRLFPEVYSGCSDLEVDGVFYKVDGHEATVTYGTPTFQSYEGRVDIPARVSAGGVTYDVTAIGNNAFRNCRQLTSVTLPPTIQCIGKYAFKDCVGLSSVNIPGSVAMIDYAAFQGCINLSSLTLNDGLEEIGYYAFQDCRSLKRLTIPGGVKAIGDGAFISCSGLTDLTINNDPDIDIDDFDGEGCEIGYAAFADCRALTTATLGDGVVGIGESAFYRCSRLQQVTMGLTMDHIASFAFNGCASLSRIISKPELPPLLAGADCFDDAHYAQVTVAVPAFARENYICDELWTRFSRIVNIEDIVVIPGDVNGDSEVSIADVNAVLAMILSGSVESPGDVNGDGEVNVADVNALVDIILGL